MDVTLVGTGDARSVTAPLCDREYCVESDRRRHPSILVETGDARVCYAPDMRRWHADPLTEIDLRICASDGRPRTAGSRPQVRTDRRQRSRRRRPDGVG